MNLDKLNNDGLSDNPELTDFYANLGLLYEQEGNWPSAIALYRIALRINPNLAIAHKKLADFWYTLKQFDKAIDSWSKAFNLEPQLIEESPEFLDLVNRYKNSIESQEAIATYENLLKANPNCVQAHISLVEVCTTELGALLKRAETLAKSEDLQVQDAVEIYCQALNTNNLIANEIAFNFYKQLLKKPNISTNTYLDLGISLVRNGMTSRIVSGYQEIIETESYRNKLYYDLAMAISQKGLMESAIAFFNAAEKPKAETEIYETIWKYLNGLGCLNEDDPLYQIEIKPEAAEAYFNEASQCKLMKVWQLTTNDQKFLVDHGISIEYLELMTKSSPELEQIYVNSFEDNKTVDFIQESLSVKTNPTIERTDRWFQQSIAETGYIYLTCPSTGRIIRSNQSFPLPYLPGYSSQRIIYRFVGEQVFYVMCSPWFWEKSFVYFPTLETIIMLRYSPLLMYDTPIFDTFKAYAVSCWKEFKSYTESGSPKKTAVILGLLSNVSHYIFIDLSGLSYLEQTQRLGKIDTFLAGSWEYINVELLFPKIPSDKVLSLAPANADKYNLFKFVLKNNYFTFTPSDFIITEDVAKRIYLACFQKCSEDFLEQLNKAKTHFPLILIQIRSHNRCWLSQVESVASLLKQLYLDYPNLGVVFDGWTAVEGKEENSKEQQNIERDRETVNNICSLLPSEIPVHSTVGSSIYETIIFASAINFYIATFGSGFIFPLISNKPGVIMVNTAFHKSQTVQNQYIHRENVIMPMVVPIEHIFNETDPTNHNSSFDYDWSVVYDVALKVLQSLSQAKDNSSLSTSPSEIDKSHDAEK
ncbi:MAG: tetratricopeptide repeat protein [Trichodesmium sp. MAG_R04]|nr:tetratricopeptide repeat protein [Trichodesmium sp. MAG_R04]